MPAYIEVMERTHSLTSVSDEELLRRLSHLLGQSRRNEADLVAHIGEVDRRRLYAREASPSMFGYCTEILHLSEAEAYLRIAAARAAREHPLLLTLLADGRLHLTAIAKLAPHLTPENREDVLERAAHRSKREIEELVAELAPRPDAPAVMRKLPDRRAGTTSPALQSARPPRRLSDCVRREVLRSIANCVRAELTRASPNCVSTEVPRVSPDCVWTESRRQGSKRVRPERERCRPLPGTGPRWSSPLPRLATRSSSLPPPSFTTSSSGCGPSCAPRCPTATSAAIVEQAVTEKLQRLEARRFARTQKPRKTLSQSKTSPTTRQIPAAVKRAVYERDGGRCRYEDAKGRRCTARQGLEYHHRRPFGHGGDHSVDNVALACKCHNAYLAEIDYGREAIAPHRRSATRRLEPAPHPSP